MVDGKHSQGVVQVKSTPTNPDKPFKTVLLRVITSKN
ncbi:hypothetical protein DFO77_10438 [Marinilabilia salmonicolor]|uniref:Uncharacterized protein n=1 Tax=Marinilabilia salmonicolor TaxID=989 RepID=A0A368VH00_9BACT|nr:hypothetical protein DFO77_10438 [Marinilabilia salmonicolor]